MPATILRPTEWAPDAVELRLRCQPDPVTAYAEAVVAGRVPGGKYHRLACARHLKDMARQATPGFPFVFELAPAVNFFKFAERCRHYTGKKFAGQLVVLSASQRFRLGSIFGWRHATDPTLRRFTTAYNELPRKSGKTLEAAIVAIYVTFFEGEPGACGYCIATKRDQARLAWEAAAQIVKRSGLSSRIAVMANNMHRAAYAQKLEPLGADADVTDGLNPYLIINDEYHAQKTRDLVDVLESATGARTTFLHFIITTAGSDPVSPCGDEHDYACRILDGTLTDDPATLAYFAFIAHADAEDDWRAEATWRKANPHWGISVNPDDLRKQAHAAIAVPGKAAEFQQKRLNLWVNRRAPSLSLDGWRAGQSDWPVEAMAHARCWAGVDLSSKIDLAAASLVFPPDPPGRLRWRVIQRIWTPADTLQDRAHRDRAPYDIWAGTQWLTLCPGTTVTQTLIQAQLAAWRKDFDIELVGFDPWHADKLAQDMVEDDGWHVEQLIEVPQTFAHLTSAETRFKAEVLAGNVDARGCPVTAWAVGNVIDTTDGKGNILFSKKVSRGRIDPVKSITIAMSTYLRTPTPRPRDYKVLIFGGPPR